MGNVYSVKGRTVQGDIYKMNQRKDSKTNALRVKADGSPMMQAYLAIAVQKTDPALPALMAGMDTEKKAAWPKGEWQHRDFATKIEDGDSTEPNKKGKRNCDREGFAGCMIFKFSNGYAPKVVYWDAATGGWQESIPGQKGQQLKIGDYVTVVFDIEGNKSTDSPGMYLNHKTIAFEAEGAAIAQEADYTGMLGTRGPGGATPPPPSAAAVAPPAPAAIPPSSPIAAPTSGPVMLPAAGGSTYEAMIAAGWTDATMIAGGMMAAPAAPVAATPPPPPYDNFMQPAPPPPAPQRIMLPAAGGSTYEAMIAAGWTDATMIANGMMAA